MTTIILTIIGILLAAAAALMVIFYGGDAFYSGTVGAQANQIQNAGTNVVSAIQMHKAELGIAPTGIADLTTTVGRPNGAFLDEEPALPQGVGAVTVVAATGGPANARVYRIAGISGALCDRINSNLRVTPTRSADAAAALTQSAAAANPKMGCAPFPATGAVTGGVFFARA